jgi:hypothetical protein
VSESEAIRQLVDIGLAALADGYKPKPPEKPAGDQREAEEEGLTDGAPSDES